MNPLQTLMDEHRLIERALGALTGYAEALGKPGAPPAQDLGRLVRFFQEYVDRLHHGKEEDILFRAMEEAGMSRDVGPLAVMLHEHDEGRRLISGLAEALGTTEAVSPVLHAHVRSTVRAFADLLSNHILKEDQVLYPMADQLFGEGVWREVEAAFEHFAAYETDPEQVASLVSIVEELHGRYGPTGAP